LRIEQNISPIYVAEMLEISESTYRKYETDKSSPSLELLEKIAKIYNKKIVDLLPASCFYHENKGNVINSGVNESIVTQLANRIIELETNSKKLNN